MSLFERSPNVIYNYTDQILDPKVYTAKIYGEEMT